MTTSEKPETNMDAILGHAMDKPVPVEVRERMHRRLADFRERFEAEPAPAGFWTRLSAISPRAKAVVFAATAAGLAVAAGIAALMIFSARPAYALDQTLKALKQVGFMHLIQRGADGTLTDERWIEIGADGRQVRYRQDTPPNFFAVQDEKTVLAHYKDKNTVVLYTPAQQQFEWVGDLGEMLRAFQEKGNNVVIEANVQFRGHRAHLVRWLKLNAEAYIDPDTRLPMSIFGYDVSYEAPPAGTFDIVIPKEGLVVDKRPGAPPVEEPQWMKDQEAAPAKFDEAGTALAADDYEKAERLYAETVKLEPRMNWAWFWLGCAQGKQAKYDQAIGSYTKVMELFRKVDADTPHYAYLARGLAYRAKGMEAQAKPDLAVALPVMIDVLRHTAGALMFDYADDPLYRKHPKPTPEESRAKMYERLRLATGQAPTDATASDEPRIMFWENWWKVHAAEYGAVAK